MQVQGMTLNCNRWWGCSSVILQFWCNSIALSHRYSHVHCGLEWCLVKRMQLWMKQSFLRQTEFFKQVGQSFWLRSNRQASGKFIFAHSGIHFSWTWPQPIAQVFPWDPLGCEAWPHDDWTNWLSLPGLAWKFFQSRSTTHRWRKRTRWINKACATQDTFTEQCSDICECWGPANDDRII